MEDCTPEAQTLGDEGPLKASCMSFSDASSCSSCLVPSGKSRNMRPRSLLLASMDAKMAFLAMEAGAIGESIYVSSLLLPTYLKLFYKKLKFWPDSLSEIGRCDIYVPFSVLRV